MVIAFTRLSLQPFVVVTSVATTLQAYLFNQQDIRLACLETLSYASNHSTAAICWRNIDSDRELPRFRAITKLVESLKAVPTPAAEQRNGPVVTWFQISRSTRHRPWGLEIYCPKCSQPPQDDDSDLGQGSEYTLDAVTRGGYTFLTCKRCSKVASIRRPEFWLFESGVNSLMAFPQPHVHLNWEKKEEREQRLKANTRGGSEKSKKRQRPAADDNDL